MGTYFVGSKLYGLTVKTQAVEMI